MVDGSSPSPLSDYLAVTRELLSFSPLLASKPRLVVFNKMDVTHAREGWEAFREGVRQAEAQSGKREGNEEGWREEGGGEAAGSGAPDAAALPSTLPSPSSSSSASSPALSAAAAAAAPAPAAVQVLCMSAATGEGTAAVVEAAWGLVAAEAEGRKRQAWGREAWGEEEEEEGGEDVEEEGGREGKKNTKRGETFGKRRC